MSNRGRSQNFNNLIFFFAYFRSSYLRSTISQRNEAEMVSVWTESSFHRKSAVSGSNGTHIIMHNLKTQNRNQLKFWKWAFYFLFISSDTCHKKMLSESRNIPLNIKGYTTTNVHRERVSKFVCTWRERSITAPYEENVFCLKEVYLTISMFVLAHRA